MVDFLNIALGSKNIKGLILGVGGDHGDAESASILHQQTDAEKQFGQQLGFTHSFGNREIVHKDFYCEEMIVDERMPPQNS